MATNIVTISDGKKEYTGFRVHIQPIEKPYLRLSTHTPNPIN